MASRRLLVMAAGTGASNNLVRSLRAAGDGVYIVAIAWQVYEISDTPTALSLIGVAWTLPMAAFLLVGGVVSDRFDRRQIMIATDVVRAIAVTVIAVLSIAGVLELWHLFLLAVVFGTGDAFFGPAFNATVPQIVPQRMLVQANAADPSAHHVVEVGVASLVRAEAGTEPAAEDVDETAAGTRWACRPASASSTGIGAGARGCGAARPASR